MNSATTNSATRELGRIVVQVRTGHPSDLALAAAVHLAQAFRSEVEGLFVEDADVAALAGLPFAREIGFMGGQSRALSLSGLERELQLASAAIRRRLEALARSAAVPLRFHVLRDKPDRATASVCATCTSGSVVVLGEPFAAGHGAILRRLTQEIAGLAGFLLVGPAVRRMRGPVVAAADDAAHLAGIVRAAQRLNATLEAPLVVVLSDAGNGEGEALVAYAQRLLAEEAQGAQVVQVQSAHGAPAVVAETVRRLSAGFVVARYGGALVPSEGSLAHLVQALECPLLLLR
jgi:hypothetical protein